VDSAVAVASMEGEADIAAAAEGGVADKS
jgi:hypothetical protein